jgi:hypothetical protein
MLSSGGGGMKPQRRGSGNNKGFNSRSYPRGIFIDFRKQTQEMLLDYVHHHGTYDLLSDHDDEALVVATFYSAPNLTNPNSAYVQLSP